MSESVRAVRASVQIGSLTVDGFMLPDGSYRMSQTQAAECIGDDPVYARNFLGSKEGKAILGEGFTPETFEVDPTGQVRGQTRIRGWPLSVVYAYWIYRCYRGVKPAFDLVVALGTETLERRFDIAFGVTRTESERNELLGQRVQQLERDLRMLGNAYSAEDEIRWERDYYERLLRENGIDPWRIPGGEDEPG
ncbi:MULTISPECIES: hypothetical protein [unclassified Microcoleus]|uniref:hypothetical protein n=1 Tax=unclassified Microcoleus TaxID=2642155 RepID=UPI002FD36F9C